MRTVMLATALAVVFGASAASAATVTVTVNAISDQGVGAKLGTVKFRDSKYGLVIEPNLSGLPAGYRGFHVHEKASCEPGMRDGKAVAGLAAGGHNDPKKTAKHMGPYVKGGHGGDLPYLLVDGNGTATLWQLAPMLKVKDIRNHALIVHAGGDNYSDQPEPLGGGGARIACGIIPKAPMMKKPAAAGAAQPAAKPAAKPAAAAAPKKS